MEPTLFATAVLLSIIFYRQIIRTGRYGVFALKSLLFLAASLPGFALMSWQWSRQDVTGPYEPGKDPAYEVCILTLFFGIFLGALSCFSLDFKSPWKELLYTTAACFTANLVLIVFISWRGNIPITRDHLSFLFFEAPSIVGRYVMRLPWDGWTDGWWLFKNVMSQFSLTSARPSVQRRHTLNQDEMVHGNLTRAA